MPMFRERRRLVRLHLHDRNESVEGVQLGRYHDGCYRLAKAVLLTAPAHPGAPPSRHQLEGVVEIARGDVLLCQALQAVAVPAGSLEVPA